MTEVTSSVAKEHRSTSVEIEIGQFPIRDDIDAGESGNGYVLRMAVANLLGGVPAVKKMLGKNRFAVLDANDAERVANWFGADPAQLGVAFGSTGIGRNTEEFEFHGYVLSRSYFINRMYPRVCPTCLKITGRCRAEWELSLVTACALHGSLLIDKCPYCLKQLSWNRATMGTCQCGCSLQEIGDPASASTLELGFSRWCRSRFFRSETIVEPELTSQLMTCATSLTRFIEPLSLQGGLSLVYALGTADRYSRADFQVSHRKKSRIGAAQELLHRGSSILTQIEDGSRIEFKASSLSVVVKLLAESASASSQPADKSLAYSLVSQLLHSGGRTTWKSRYPQLSQLELFP